MLCSSTHCEKVEYSANPFVELRSVAVKDATVCLNRRVEKVGARTIWVCFLICLAWVGACAPDLLKNLLLDCLECITVRVVYESVCKLTKQLN